jgi:hypothetical protein
MMNIICYHIVTSQKGLYMTLCIRCGGTKKYLGNGFVITDCELCKSSSISTTNAYNSNSNSNQDLSKIDRRSSAYKKAINDLLAINTDMSRKDAVKLFDDTYNKV